MLDSLDLIHLETFSMTFVRKEFDFRQLRHEMDWDKAGLC